MSRFCQFQDPPIFPSGTTDRGCKALVANPVKTSAAGAVVQGSRLESMVDINYLHLQLVSNYIW